MIYNHPKLVSRWADRAEVIASVYGDYVAQAWAKNDMRFDSMQQILLNRELQRREEMRGKPR